MIFTYFFEKADMTPLDLLIEALDAAVEEKKRASKESEEKLNIVDQDEEAESVSQSQQPCSSSSVALDSAKVCSGKNDISKLCLTEEKRNFSSPSTQFSSESSVRSATSQNSAPLKKDWNNYKASDKASSFYNDSASSKENLIMREKRTGLRIMKPLLNQQELDVQMLGKNFIPLSNLKACLAKISARQDWTTIGVMYNKQSKKSLKNNKVFSIWKMTDLQGSISTVTCMLFGRAQQRHYATPVNTVIGLLNPKIMEDRNNFDSRYASGPSLSIEHPDQLLELGYCKDIGTCKAKKKDGEQCNNLVNVNVCDHCTHHLTKAYRALSGRRGDIQSSFSGSEGVRARIMSKIDPKANYFGSGQFLGNQGAPMTNLSRPQSMSCPIETTNNGLQSSKTKNLSKANLISPKDVIGEMKKKNPLHLSEDDKEAVRNMSSDVSAGLGLRLLQPTPGARGLLKHIQQQSSSTSEPKRDCPMDNKKADAQNRVTDDASQGAKKLLFEHKKQKAEERARALMVQRANNSVPPIIGKGFTNGQSIDLTAKAVSTLRAKGIASISKVNPNHTPKRKRSLEETSSSHGNIIKRVRQHEELRNFDHVEKSKKEKEKQAWISNIVQSKSLNEQLVSEHEDNLLQERFDFLEKKEAVETRMMDTKSVETIAVTCSTCNYTAFSQSEFCRSQNHNVKRIKATKRFFACAQCKNRVVSLDRYPKHSCSNCFGSKWNRTALMDDTSCTVKPKEQLLVRGKEQKFVNQTIRSCDLNINSID